MTDDDLPPLPRATTTDRYGFDLWGEYAMLAYARAAIRHFIARQKPVALMYWDRMAGEHDVRVGEEAVPIVGAVPLFRLDGGGDDAS